MPKELNWNDADDLGILLSQKYPNADPLAVSLPDIRRYVTALPEFKDDPQRSTEGNLQAILMAWQAEFLDRTQG